MTLTKEQKKEVDAGKVTGDQLKADEAHQELSQTNPAEARSTTAPWVDQHTVQNQGTDPLQGGFVSVTGGEYAGRYGVYEDNGQVDPETLRPVTIIVKTRDDRHERIVVNYDDCERAQAGGRR